VLVFNSYNGVCSRCVSLYLGGSSVVTQVPSNPIMTWGLSSYNVGIGTTIAGYKLDVNGDINCASGSAYRLASSKILWYNTATTSNIFVGVNAGNSISSGQHNTFVGGSAGAATTTGMFNTFVGENAGQFINATGCVAVGQGALVNSTTQSWNAAIGTSAGQANTTGTQNTFLGTFADASVGNLVNATAIGYGAVVNASHKVRIGNAFVSVVEGPVAYTVSDGRFKFNVKEEVAGLEFINKLRPVNYQMDTKKLNEHIRKGMPQERGDGNQSKINNNSLDFTPSTSIIHSGFIAQEVEQAVIATGFKTDIVHAPENENDNYSLAYGEFVVPLVKAVQELSAKVNHLEKELEQANSKGNTQGAAIPNGGQGNTTIHELELANNTVLFQNFPNPFGDGTTIKYFIPDNIQNAQIVFFDEFGNKLNEFKVAEKGMGQLNIASANLSTGSYSYSLIVNNKVLDTKKMMKIK
jgi:trimeric autotransporter adhesin